MTSQTGDHSRSEKQLFDATIPFAADSTARNIGYHHVHHLNPHIPFYRLPEAMAAIPELQHPIVTSLRPHDVLACFRANLWETHTQRMVSYNEAARSPS